VRDRALEWAELLGFGADDKPYIALSLHFTGGRHWTIAGLSLGATVVLRDERLGPEALWTEINRYECTHTYLIPFWMRGCVKHLQKPRSLPTLRGLLSCADFLRPAEKVEFRRVLCEGLCEAYSTSEVGLATFASTEDHLRFDSTVGRAVRGGAVEVVDEDDQPVAPGVLGEIRYKNRMMPSGYHENPQYSAERFRDGWFYPRDCGIMNEEGYLFLKGRTDGMVSRIGVLMHPAEIEQSAVTMPGLKEAVVVHVPGSDPARLELFVEGEGNVSVDAVRRHLAGALQPFKHPDRIEIIAQMPRTPTGKVARSELAKHVRGPDQG
jgi:acyl-coenzyme A synthetase/AMP-(fatty) acid ligase